MRIKRALADQSGVAAVEFAIIAPVMLFLMFAIFDVGFLTWNFMLTSAAADSVGKYMRAQRVEKKDITATGLRSAACAGMAGRRCDEAKLKIALLDATNPVANPIAVPALIENNVGAMDKEAYVVAVGYEWGLFFPTSHLLLHTDGVRGQIQATTYTVLTERPID